jgi:hypothetical protein
MENNKPTQEDLINKIFFLSEIQAEIWRYHPLNPACVDVLVEYDKITDEIRNVKRQIDELENN